MNTEKQNLIQLRTNKYKVEIDIYSDTPIEEVMKDLQSYVDKYYGDK